MSSSWLWQPFGSCFCSIMVLTSQYCLPLTSCMENSVEPPFSWKRLLEAGHCIGDPLYWDWDPATGTGQGQGPGPGPGPGHRATKTRPWAGQMARTWAGTGTGTGPPGHGKKRAGPETGTDGATGTGHRDRPQNPGTRAPDQTKMNLYPMDKPCMTLGTQTLGDIILATLMVRQGFAHQPSEFRGSGLLPPADRHCHCHLVG